jgi:hypothetical protein
MSRVWSSAALAACLMVVASGDRDLSKVVPGTAAVVAAAATIDVPAGGNLQQAFNDVQPGGTIRLAEGATFAGNFKLPAKDGSSYILVTTNTALPAAGTRIDPTYKSRLATIKSTNTISALTTAAGASYYRFIGVAFEANASGAGDIIALGTDAQSLESQVPHHIWFDRVLVAGSVTAGQKRGISVNASDVTIENSDFREIKAVGQDSQAICGWNTPGRITIRNNYLSAAGENVMFGGAQTNLPGSVPSDIIVEDNVMTKDVAWRGTSWTVKNIFELKAGRRVSVRRNLFEYNWAGSQPGFAIVFTPRNSGGRNPWTVVEDVDFTDNLVRHTGSAFNLLGHDDIAPSGQLARVRIVNNLVYDVSSTDWGGSGYFAQIGGEPAYITFDHNTVLHNGNIVTFYSGSYMDANGTSVPGGPITGFTFTNNLLKHNAYGIFGSGQAFGSGSLNFYAPGAVVANNVMASDTSVASRYPAGNFFPTVAAFMAGFQNAAGNNYRLLTTSPYVRAATDGKDIGYAFAVGMNGTPPVAPAALRILR